MFNVFGKMDISNIMGTTNSRPIIRYISCLFLLIGGWTGFIIMIYGASSDITLSKLFGCMIIADGECDPLVWLVFFAIAAILTPITKRIETFVIVAGLSSEFILSGWLFITCCPEVKMQFLAIVKYVFIISLIAVFQTFLVLIFVEHKDRHSTREVNVIIKSNFDLAKKLNLSKTSDANGKPHVILDYECLKKLSEQVDEFNRSKLSKPAPEDSDTKQAPPPYSEEIV